MDVRIHLDDGRTAEHGPVLRGRRHALTTTGIIVKDRKGWLTELHGLVRVPFAATASSDGIGNVEIESVTVDGVLRSFSVFGDVTRRGWVVAFETEESEALRRLWEL